MPGIYDISRTIRPRCPECGATLDVGALGNELFRRMLNALTKGKAIRVDGFGIIEPHVYMPKKPVHTVYGDYIAAQPFAYVRLRLSRAAKSKFSKALANGDLNCRMNEEADDGEQRNKDNDRENVSSV